jgi:hypothetical protein
MIRFSIIQILIFMFSVIIRQRPPAPVTPPPIIIRERPPTPPTYTEPKVILNGTGTNNDCSPSCLSNNEKFYSN